MTPRAPNPPSPLPAEFSFHTHKLEADPAEGGTLCYSGTSLQRLLDHSSTEQTANATERPGDTPRGRGLERLRLAPKPLSLLLRCLRLAPEPLEFCCCSLGARTDLDDLGAIALSLLLRCLRPCAQGILLGLDVARRDQPPQWSK